MAKLRWLVVLGIVLLTNCSLSYVSPTPPMQSVTSTTLVLPVPTQSPTATIIATYQPVPTITPSAAEPTATNPVALHPERVLKYKRLDIAASLPPDAVPSGALAFSGQRSYLQRFGQDGEQEISGIDFCVSSSPDGKWLACGQSSAGSSANDQLVILKADGQVQEKIAVKEGWWWNFGNIWLDNERLAFNFWKDKSTVPTIFSTIVVNPFTGEQQEILSDYPDLQPSISGPEGTIHFVYSTVVYDPSLNLVIYPQTTEDGWYVVLWDRQAKRTLARVKDGNEFQHLPLWSPDGKQFVIAVDNQAGKRDGEWIDEWFSVSRDGQIGQLTHFGDYFEDAKIGHANWSPDGRHLAFWLDATPSLCEWQNLVVLEVDTQQVVNYCVLGSDDRTAPSSPPIWSPDSRYIAVDSYQSGVSRVILVDATQDWAAIIGYGAYPIGWLASP